MSGATEDRDALLRGATLFDGGAFFEAHEAWEERWRVTRIESERRLLQGLIQIAAALHKLIVMGAPEAAARLFARGLAKLDASPDDCAAEHGLDLVAFREGIRRCATDLAALRFDRSAIPRMAPRR